MPRILISEPGKKPQPYKVKLDRDAIKIGRAANSDILLSDPSTSSLHCVIRRVEGGFILEDNNSTNGVKLEEQRFKKIDVNQDLDFKLGDVDVEFSFTDEEYEELAEEEDFESEQQPLLPPSKENRSKRRDKRESSKEAKNNDGDIELEEDEDEDEGKEDKGKRKAKRSSSSRASRILETDEDDDDDEDDDSAPRRKKSSSAQKPPPRRAQRIAAQNKSNALVTILFIFLCILGFVGGLCIKHYQENKTFLITDLINGQSESKEEPKDDKNK